MQRRLDIAMGLIHRPQVLFLDEPTTGLDPEVRAGMWAEIAHLSAAEGLTILLTTHYLEEADRLAGRLAIVDRGRVVAEGSPDELKGELRGDAIHVELGDPEADGRATAALDRCRGLGGGGRRPLPAGPDRRRLGGRPGRAPGPGGRRDPGRLGDHRPPLARRRLPAPHRPLPSPGWPRRLPDERDPDPLLVHDRAPPAQPGPPALVDRDHPGPAVIWLLLFGAVFKATADIPGSRPTPTSTT
jgi:hypothetical protein